MPSLSRLSLPLPSVVLRRCWSVSRKLRVRGACMLEAVLEAILQRTMSLVARKSLTNRWVFNGGRRSHDKCATSYYTYLATLTSTILAIWDFSLAPTVVIGMYKPRMVAFSIYRPRHYLIQENAPVYVDVDLEAKVAHYFIAFGTTNPWN